LKRPIDVTCVSVSDALRTPWRVPSEALTDRAGIFCSRFCGSQRVISTSMDRLLFESIHSHFFVGKVGHSVVTQRQSFADCVQYASAPCSRDAALCWQGGSSRVRACVRNIRKKHYHVYDGWARTPWVLSSAVCWCCRLPRAVPRTKQYHLYDGWARTPWVLSSAVCCCCQLPPAVPRTDACFTSFRAQRVVECARSFPSWGRHESVPRLLPHQLLRHLYRGALC